MPWQWWVPAFRNLAQAAAGNRLEGHFGNGQSVNQQVHSSMVHVAGWWFGTSFFFHILEIVTPTDFHIFQRG